MELANEGRFSNASGCGFPPIGSPTKVITGTRRECKKLFGIETCVNIPTVRTVPNEEYLGRLKNYNDCVKNKIEQGVEGIKNTANKVTKKISQLVGKAKAAMQKLLKKAILKKANGAIRINAHGIATRLYPAIISQESATKLRYKKSFVSKAKSSYNEVLSQWVALGGTAVSLNDAIKVGASKRVHRFKKSPYGLSKTIKKSSFDGGWSNWSGDKYSNVMGPEEDEIPEVQVPGSEGLTAEELAALNEQGADENVDQEEKMSGFRALIERILSIFRRNKADEIPYEEGTPEAAYFNADTQYDTTNLPDASGDAAKKLADVISGKSGDQTTYSWYERYKTQVWIGVGVLAVVGGVLAYRKWSK